MELSPRDDALIILAAPSYEPYTSPALMTNLVFRVVLGIIANLVCLVPLRLLYRHGEFAAVVFIINVEAKNLGTVINALIWRDDNMGQWWPGYGFCDLSSFLHNFSIGLFATCLLAIMRNLAHQVGIMRANPLTVREKRRRNLIQALIMFPLPIVQLSFTWFLTAQRYAVGTLVGCAWVGYGAWPYLVFFVLAPVVVALMTSGYAILMYFRFREVAKTTASALTSNRVASLRAQRTRRRLYLMVVSIMVPFLPIVLILCVLNIMDMGYVRPFNYDDIHNHAEPYPWNTIIYIPSSQIDFSFMNNCYIAIFTAIPIFLFFGMTRDAMNDYRLVLVFLGLGRVFPGLYQEYDPDRHAYADYSLNSRGTTNNPGTSSVGKSKVLTTIQQLRSFSSSVGSSTARGSASNQTSLLTSRDMENGTISPVQRPEVARCSTPSSPPVELPHRNPFLFRTTLDFPVPFTLPFFGSSSRRGRRQSHQQDPAVQAELAAYDLQPMRPAAAGNWAPPAATEQPSGIQTRVWSDDEVRLCGNDDPNADTRSVSSAQGVVVETLLTRETHDIKG